MTIRQKRCSSCCCNSTLPLDLNKTQTVNIFSNDFIFILRLFNTWVIVCIAYARCSASLVHIFFLSLDFSHLLYWMCSFLHISLDFIHVGPCQIDARIAHNVQRTWKQKCKQMSFIHSFIHHKWESISYFKYELWGKLLGWFSFDGMDDGEVGEVSISKLDFEAFVPTSPRPRLDLLGLASPSRLVSSRLWLSRRWDEMCSLLPCLSDSSKCGQSIRWLPTRQAKKSFGFVWFAFSQYCW